MPSFPLNCQFEWRVANLIPQPLPGDTNSLERRYPSAWPPRRANLQFAGNSRFEEARESTPAPSIIPGFPNPCISPGT